MIRKYCHIKGKDSTEIESLLEKECLKNENFGEIGMTAEKRAPGYALQVGDTTATFYKGVKEYDLRVMGLTESSIDKTITNLTNLLGVEITFTEESR